MHIEHSKSKKVSFVFSSKTALRDTFSKLLTYKRLSKLGNFYIFEKFEKFKTFFIPKSSKSDKYSLIYSQINFVKKYAVFFYIFSKCSLFLTDKKTFRLNTSLLKIDKGGIIFFIKFLKSDN